MKISSESHLHFESMFSVRIFNDFRVIWVLIKPWKRICQLRRLTSQIGHVRVCHWCNDRQEQGFEATIEKGRRWSCLRLLHSNYNAPFGSHRRNGVLSRSMVKIIMEHIYKNCRGDSKLFFVFICSVKIFNVFGVMNSISRQKREWRRGKRVCSCFPRACRASGRSRQFGNGNVKQWWGHQNGQNGMWSNWESLSTGKSRITHVRLIFPTEHIDMKNSLESPLHFWSICSVGIRSSFKVIKLIKLTR